MQSWLTYGLWTYCKDEMWHDLRSCFIFNWVISSTLYTKKLVIYPLEQSILGASGLPVVSSIFGASSWSLVQSIPDVNDWPLVQVAFLWCHLNLEQVAYLQNGLVQIVKHCYKGLSLGFQNSNNIIKNNQPNWMYNSYFLSQLVKLFLQSRIVRFKTDFCQSRILNSGC